MFARLWHVNSFGRIFLALSGAVVGCLLLSAFDASFSLDTTFRVSSLTVATHIDLGGASLRAAPPEAADPAISPSSEHADPGVGAMCRDRLPRLLDARLPARPTYRPRGIFQSHRRSIPDFANGVP